MNMPWHGRAGLAKSTAIFATLLLVSLGLCGTSLAFTKLGAVPGNNTVTIIWIVVCFTELAGILVGIIGLVVVALIAIFRAISRPNNPSSGKEKSN
jgi:hypothetical protein